MQNKYSMCFSKEFLDKVQVEELYRLKLISSIKDIGINDIIKYIPNTLPNSKIQFKIENFVYWWRVGYYENNLKLIVTDSKELIDGLFGLVCTLKIQNLI